jgi:hypothetical protein
MFLAQAFWDTLDDADTAFASTSAKELGVKMASRQCILITGAGFSNSSAVFNVTDAPSFCAIANKNTYDSALITAGAVSGKRFAQYGQPFIFADDVIKEGGPWWLDASLQFNAFTQPDGSKVISVASPSQKTEIDYWQRHFPFPRPSFIPDPGCFHYCKLLSPARVMEWVYVDGLRLKRSV